MFGLMKWMFNKLVSGLFLIVLLLGAHDVGNARAGGNSLLLPTFCKGIYSLFAGEDQDEQHVERKPTIEETDDVGLLSEFAKRRLFQRSDSERN